LNIPGRHQGEIGHDDKRRAMKLLKRPVDRIIQGFFSNSDERVFMFEGMCAEQSGAAPGL